MRIKVAILDRDLEYLERRQSFLTNLYGQQLEVLVFTDPQAAMASVERDRIRVLIIGEHIDVNPDTIVPTCACAFLVESSQIAEFNGVRAIGRHIPVDEFYREITLLFDSVSRAAQYRSKHPDESASKIVTFTSPAGGVGTTSAAVAFTRVLALAGHRPLYLNLDPFQQTEDFLQTQPNGTGSFHDIVFAIKERRSLATQFEARAVSDQYGVRFFSSAPLAADVNELNADDLIYLLEQVINQNTYDFTVVDIPFALSEAERNVFNASDRIIWVSNGRHTVNNKITRGLETLSVVDEREDTHISAKTNLLYNRFSSKLSSRIADLPVPELGGINRFENATELQVVDAIVASGRLSPLAGEFSS
ncbi:AAA domain-containing protein [Micrococcales bacterium KH10]|nr:AAA domain-containing protein [Micrococcales bacterium KH10]